MNEDKKELPTQSGAMQGYEAEWKTNDEWLRIPCTSGAPYPDAFGGILKQIGLMSEAQAESHRWLFISVAEERGKLIETRLQEYEIVYEIKARKV